MTRRFLLTLRTLLRRRGAYLPATGILALGIGMSVAMFSLLDAVLLRPLPFPGQERIQVIWKANPATGPQVEELAYPELRDLQENIGDFEYVAVMPTSLYGYGRILQRGDAEPVQIESAPVSHDFFRVLGVSPVMGRNFETSDEHVGAAPVVILSDRVWREQQGADRNIIGKTIRLNSQGHTVIGVMAPGVEFPRGAGLWIPLGVEQRIVERRGATFLQAIARVRPGRGGIPAKLNALFQRLAADHPEVYSPSQQGVVTPLVEYWTGSARAHLWIMLAASVLLLIAAIVGAGNLFLSRTLARRPEIATRLALGASARQILAQLGAEGTVVAAIAAVSGLVLAQGVIRFLVLWAPADIPRLSQASLDLRAFGFACAAAAIAAVACSIIPGWAATRMPRRRSSRTRSFFILTQAAATMLLLTVSVLLTLSYRSMMSVEIGFANRDAVTMNLRLRGRTFYTNLLNRLRQTPGVTSAGAVLVRPLEGTIGWDVSYEFGFEKQDRELPKANYEVITPGYFQTVGTPLLEGRDFSEHDTEAGERVVIISRALAERIRAAGYQPVGYRMRLGLGGWMKVIGVASDARYRNVTQTGPDVFVPYLQAAQPTNYVVIRGSRPASELSDLVRRTLAGIDSSQAVAGVATIGELIDANSARHRFNMILLLWFGVCGAILAAAGVYSVIAEMMAAREREIAIKNALGAPKARLVSEMVSRTLGFVLLGEVIGAAGIASLGPLASNLLYGVSYRDPVVFTCVAGFLFAVSLTAASWPAWRSAGAPHLVRLR